MLGMKTKGKQTERKHLCQLGRKIVERAHMKRKGGHKYAALARGRPTVNWGKGKIGMNCGKKDGNSKCCSVCQCYSGKAGLVNYENFRKSLLPMRVMYFRNGVWNDFSSQASDSLRVAFSACMPTVEVIMDGTPYLVDFLRMLQIDLRVGCQRSIAWIDEDGSCFFPKFIVEDNVDEEVNPRVEVEIGIRISPTEGSKTEAESCGEVAGNIEVCKTVKDCLPSNDEVLKVQKFGFPSGLKLLSKVRKTDGEFMNSPVAMNLTNRTSTEIPTSPTSPNKWARGCSDAGLSRVPIPEPMTKVLMNGPQANHLTNQSSIEFPKGTDELERKLGDVALSTILKLDPSIKVPTCTNEMEKGMGVSHDEVFGDPVNGGTVNRHLFSESQQCSRNIVAPDFEHLGDRLIKLGDGDEEYIAVQKEFLAGLMKVELATTITGIYRNAHTSRLGQARMQAFYKQVELTRSSRGNPNVTLAWYGTSDTGVSTITLHGFSNSRIVNDGPAYGVGVYLAQVNCSYLSVPFSEVNKCGEQYAVLCRAILGNVEEVRPGSQQFHPSCEKFDSGIDDLTNPKYYIIWSTHMNTHILPEYIVSFKAPQQLYVNQGASDVPKGLGCNMQDGQVAAHCFVYERNPYTDSNKESKQVPSKESLHLPSPSKVLFLKLFSIIRKILPSASTEALDLLLISYKEGRVGTEMFIRNVRMIAGDKLLISVIRSLRGQARSGAQQLNTEEYGQHSVVGSESLNSNIHFTSCTDQMSQMRVARADIAPQSLLASKILNLDNQSTTLLMDQTGAIGEQSGMAAQCFSRPES